MHRNIKLSVLAAAIASSGAVAYAYAGSDRQENDAVAIDKARISLAQAVAIAERHVQGKASRAEYEDSKQGWVFDVEVVSGAKVFGVRVDADKGAIISSAEDNADRDDDHDKLD